VPAGPHPMIRAALVGVSGYARWHLLMAMEQALVGRLQLVGVTIINPTEEPMICARLSRQGIPVFNRWEDMLRALSGRLDLLLLPTGIQWHAPMTIAALQAGANVLVEKPLAATLQEIDAITAAQATTARLVAVGFQDLYVPAAHDIKHRILAGEIGPLRQITVCARWPRPSTYYARNSWAGSLRTTEGWVLDSPANNALSHFLMLALFWAGEQATTAAVVTELAAELYRVNPIESFDTISLAARTARGVAINFYGTHAGQTERAPEIRLQGATGQISWIYEKQYTVAVGSAAPLITPVPEQLDTRLSVLEAVINRLHGASSFIVEPNLARAHTRLINALHQFFPIHTVAAPHQFLDQPPAGSGYRLQNIDALLDEAAERNVLLSETAAPWAVRGKMHSLGDYQAFAGCWTPPA
jgi:predicted dehydrogenase